MVPMAPLSTNTNAGLDETQFQVLSQCPVCQGSGRKARYRIKQSIVYQCIECWLKYLDPCLSAHAMRSAYESEQSLMSYHAFHQGYYGYGDLSKPSKTLREYAHGLDLLENILDVRYLSRKGTIFDVGFGSGLFLALARKRGWEVDGLDSSATNLKMVQERYGLQLTQGSFEEYQPSAKRYDVISFWDVIEHFANPRAILLKASTLLKPKGLILVAVPNDNSTLAHVAGLLYRVTGGYLKKGVDTFYALEHVAYYNSFTMAQLASRVGLAVEDYFLSSTDLDKYSFSRLDRFVASCLLFLGKVLRHENRLITVLRAS